MRLLEGPVGRTLARLALPNIVVVATQTLVTGADAWFVGKLGVAGLAALALGTYRLGDIKTMLRRKA